MGRWSAALWNGTHSVDATLFGGSQTVSPGTMLDVIQELTLWLLKIAMGNGHVQMNFPLNNAFYQGFSIAIVNNQMVYLNPVSLMGTIHFISPNCQQGYGTSYQPLLVVHGFVADIRMDPKRPVIFLKGQLLQRIFEAA